MYDLNCSTNLFVMLVFFRLAFSVRNFSEKGSDKRTLENVTLKSNS